MMAQDRDSFPGTGAAETHFWLTQGMARTAGVNLTSAIAGGRLTRADLASMVVRCGSCEYAERCVRWMAEGQHLDGDPPPYCLNHEAISALKTRA